MCSEIWSFVFKGIKDEQLKNLILGFTLSYKYYLMSILESSRKTNWMLQWAGFDLRANI